MIDRPVEAQSWLQQVLTVDRMGIGVSAAIKKVFIERRYVITGVPVVTQTEDQGKVATCQNPFILQVSRVDLVFPFRGAVVGVVGRCGIAVIDIIRPALEKGQDATIGVAAVTFFVETVLGFRVLDEQVEDFEGILLETTRQQVIAKLVIS